MPPTIAHYIWIGQPPPANSKYAGQDLIGPDLMSKRYKEQPIRFYCLKDYAPHYQKHFEAQPNVTVVVIEDYISSKNNCVEGPYSENSDQQTVFFCLASQVKQYQELFKTQPNIQILSIESYFDIMYGNDPNEEQAIKKVLDRKNIQVDFLGFLENIRKRAESLEGPNRFRDLVTLKAAFQYFLQATERGFVMDTNVTPIFDNNPRTFLPEIPRFAIPILWDLKIEQPFETGVGVGIDAWLMCAVGKDDYSLRKFLLYFRAALEDLDSKELSSPGRRENLAQAFIYAAQEGEHDRINAMRSGEIQADIKAILELHPEN